MVDCRRLPRHRAVSPADGWAHRRETFSPGDGDFVAAEFYECGPGERGGHELGDGISLCYRGRSVERPRDLAAAILRAADLVEGSGVTFDLIPTADAEPDTYRVILYGTD
ncbi:hypothetical protein GCM10011575_00040 [Microlunatus endophyticus]|uniref:Uncharacterized protein n=1 Tax=Microlunatus endophyticus TaxID=1716077 RepID=A0A917S034_9ACTN|nr:hypothetical protein [Microlunatus endophyticus]GGL46084.1 hypothetical protein GCM10011575_00040 [Microlunatus endophyticus]